MGEKKHGQTEKRKKSETDTAESMLLNRTLDSVDPLGLGHGRMLTVVKDKQALTVIRLPCTAILNDPRHVIRFIFIFRGNRGQNTRI